MQDALLTEVGLMRARDMRLEMMRMLSVTAMLASGVSLGVGAVIVGLVALLQ